MSSFFVYVQYAEWIIYMVYTLLCFVVRTLVPVIHLKQSNHDGGTIGCQRQLPVPPWWDTWARFLSLTRSKLRLCSANHRAGYFSNLACDWLSIVWAYSEQETENGPWFSILYQIGQGGFSGSHLSTSHVTLKNVDQCITWINHMKDLMWSQVAPFTNMV